MLSEGCPFKVFRTNGGDEALAWAASRHTLSMTPDLFSMGSARVPLPAPNPPPSLPVPAHADRAPAVSSRRHILPKDLPAAIKQLDDQEQARSIVGARLDIVVANAGASKAATIVDTTIEDFDNLFAVNVRAPFFLVRQLLPILGSSSSIVLVSSLAAHAAVGTLSAYTRRREAWESRRPPRSRRPSSTPCSQRPESAHASCRSTELG
jgi:Enoyl-(Acyl carrier protein) reductase